jgi:hypothetical protein
LTSACVIEVDLFLIQSWEVLAKGSDVEGLGHDVCEMLV